MKEISIFTLSVYDYIRTRAIPFPGSEQMSTLESFLASDVQNFGQWVIENLVRCQQDLKCEGFTMNLIDIQRVSDEKVSLSYMFSKDPQDLVISIDDLIRLTKEWIDLAKQKVPYIILERNDDSYSVRGAQTLE